MNKSCQNCQHVETCYISRTLVEVVEMAPDVFENPKKAIPEIWTPVAENCRHYKERK